MRMFKISLLPTLSVQVAKYLELVPGNFCMDPLSGHEFIIRLMVNVWRFLSQNIIDLLFRVAYLIYHINVSFPKFWTIIDFDVFRCSQMFKQIYFLFCVISISLDRISQDQKGTQKCLLSSVYIEYRKYDYYWNYWSFRKNEYCMRSPILVPVGRRC